MVLTDIATVPARSVLGGYLVGSLALLLGVSVLANVLLWNQRDRALLAERDRDAARAQASACSDATADLRELADQQIAAGKKARAEAAAAGRQLQQRADRTLSTPPADPADLCASTQRLTDEWLQERVGR
ncbi:hypothetical protein [uncultured Xylophilus sp.]|uniref:hypothetical protein n=1 Tax=uncultured Xylophilus sp. TaxID=296832 RepID=UPI0025CCC38A|nr:hypothetical protein [uncultured Xylophilus sp.]